MRTQLIGMSGEEYKPIHRASAKNEPADEIATLHAEVSNISADLSKFKDPVVQGSLLYKLQQERENSNRLLKTILETMDSRLAKMEERIAAMEARAKTSAAHPAPAAPSAAPAEEVLLASVDEDIVSFIKSKGRICAEDVRVHFHYKGKNAASSRLNRLFELGVLEKRQAGRVVYYKLKQ